MAKHYVKSGRSRQNKPHNIKHDQINKLFLSNGWIGKRRRPVEFLKTLPVVERGQCNAGKA